jgi:hypothetical protein
MAVLAPEVLGVGGEALVEPDLRPVLAGDQITPPLVGQFVGDDVVIVEVDLRPLVEQAAVGHGRRRGVLHRAEEEVVDQRLRIFRVGIVYSVTSAEKNSIISGVRAKRRRPSARRSG